MHATLIRKEKTDYKIKDIKQNTYFLHFSLKAYGKLNKKVQIK